MESTSAQAEPAAAPPPVLTSLATLTMLSSDESGDVCGVDGVC